MSAAPRLASGDDKPGKQPHRPQVHVLLEHLAQRQNHVAGGNVVGHRRRADGAEIDGVELGQLLERVLVEHALMLQVELASPRKVGERQADVAAARHRLERRHARWNHFAADPVARNHRHTKRRHLSPFEC